MNSPQDLPLFKFDENSLMLSYNGEFAKFGIGHTGWHDQCAKSVSCDSSIGLIGCMFTNFIPHSYPWYGDMNSHFFVQIY